MLEVTLKLTDKEAIMLKSAIQRATDLNDAREKTKSQSMQELEAKVIAAVVIAQQENAA